MHYALVALFILLPLPAVANSLVGSLHLHHSPSPGVFLNVLDATVTLEQLQPGEQVWVSRYSTFLNVPGAWRITSLDGIYNGNPTSLADPFVPFYHTTLFSWAVPNLLGSTADIGLVWWDGGSAFPDSGAIGPS
jgi:hypothetical protein